MMGDSLAAVPGPDPDAPHRPHIEVVHVRDLAVTGKTGVGARMDGRPAHHLVAVVRQHPGRRILLSPVASPFPRARGRAAAGAVWTGCGSSGTSTRSRRAAWVPAPPSRPRTPSPDESRSPCRHHVTGLPVRQGAVRGQRLEPHYARCVASALDCRTPLEACVHEQHSGVGVETGSPATRRRSSRCRFSGRRVFIRRVPG